MNAVGINISKEMDKSRHLLLYRQHVFCVFVLKAGMSLGGTTRNIDLGPSPLIGPREN